MANIILLIPESLYDLSDGNKELCINASTVGNALFELRFEYKELSERLITSEGQIRNFINIYLGKDNIRTLNGLETTLCEGDTLLIVKAIAGG